MEDVAKLCRHLLTLYGVRSTMENVLLYELEGAAWQAPNRN